MYELTLFPRTSPARTGDAPELRLEHFYPQLHQEGMVSGLYEALKKFIDWLIERFKNIFTNNINQGSSANNPGERKVLVSEDRGNLQKFTAKKLNHYFYFSTEGEAMVQVNQVLKNLTQLEKVKKVFEEFPLDKYILPGTRLNLQDDLPELFNKKLLEATSDLGANDSSTHGDVTQGFVLTSKVNLGLQITSSGEPKLIHLKSNERRDCGDIEVYYTLTTGLGKMLNTTCGKLSDFVISNRGPCNGTLKIIEVAKNVVGESNPQMSANLALASKLCAVWMVLANEVDKLVIVLNETMDHLTKK